MAAVSLGSCGVQASFQGSQTRGIGGFDLPAQGLSFFLTLL